MQSVDKINNRVRIAKVVENSLIAKDTHQFVFEFEHIMRYKPGQYVWVELPNLHPSDPRGSRRPFSIASAPDDSNRITIIVRATDSIFNKSLRLLHPGDELNIIGPFGYSFCLPEDTATPIILIAGGTGVTPFLSIIRYSVDIQSQRSITLINANDSQERTFLNDELEAYQKNKSIRIKNLTRRFEDTDIDDIEGLHNAPIYISGPKGFVEHIHNTLKTKGVFEHQFYFEAFYPGASVDLEISELFIDGRPKIDPSEPEFTRRRAGLIYTLVNSSDTHTVVTDIHGKILFANQAAQNITGYSLSEMIGNTPRLWGGVNVEGVL